jgi:hypothetical protein
LGSVLVAVGFEAVIGRIVLLLLAGALGVFALSGLFGHGHSRQEEVAARGAEVMPFDLDRTTHRFDPRASGGVQTVVADEPDAEQVELVRSHLRDEAERFARGDFDDPMAIHGMEMPGLAELRAGAASGRVTIDYEDVPTGGRLTYHAGERTLVAALHAWFQAQVSDHGGHAEAMERGS